MITIYWPRIGGGLNAIFDLIVVWFFQAFTKPARFLLILCELFPVDCSLLHLQSDKDGEKVSIVSISSIVSKALATAN